MPYPNLKVERKLNRQGFKLVAGIDEAGKGSWAGPIVAAAVILDPKKKISGIKDSKLLRSPQRRELFKKITDTALAWSIGIISHDLIDQHGIKSANIMAIEQALDYLRPKPNYILVDALEIQYHKIPSLGIIDGDYKIKSIAAASIVAKVVHDLIMDELDDPYPQYGFKQHKGYGTNHHFQMVMQHGVSKIHRHTFQPMKHLLN
ncbi:MAG: ribonuclease HII [Patescibacteria group bacterium]|nr:ribonuclease HII [Patescibacteria group bacterium]